MRSHHAVRSLAIVVLSFLVICLDGRAQSKATDRQTIFRLEQALQETIRPESPTAERDALAKRQAEAAATLMRLGRSNSVWPLFRDGPDPSRRSYLIHSLAKAGVNPSVIMRRLKVEKNLSARRALILSLGS